MREVVGKDAAKKMGKGKKNLGISHLRPISVFYIYMSTIVTRE